MNNKKFLWQTQSALYEDNKKNNHESFFVQGLYSALEDNFEEEKNHPKRLTKKNKKNMKIYRTLFAIMISKFRTLVCYWSKIVPDIWTRLEPYWPVHLKPHSVYSRHLASIDPQGNNYTIEQKYEIFLVPDNQYFFDVKLY